MTYLSHKLIPEEIQDVARGGGMEYFLPDCLNLMLDPEFEIQVMVKMAGHGQNPFSTTKRICDTREKGNDDGRASIINSHYDIKYSPYFFAFHFVYA